ncbi:peptidylprolyl isomerase [Prevotella sp. HMSC073D09]|uniref:peptidylprolyl isomerase n=1 Tax=Prevotella sp. HMSC073D09 TaxID=1739459 RepID=UPI0008A43FDB|nr:peptidylprolyl isomerase [Prevotella sp. HMSC073D09]OFQ23415.1 peptidylprolyl isomerase [Prevotella sp. HMSC073D09]
MAVLGKIRSRGMILIGIIGLGLLAFIAEEAFRSCEATRNNQRQQVGEVNGQKISVQEFQKMVDEYAEAIKMQQGQDNLNDEQLNQVKDMVWTSYVQNKLVEKEAKELGLTVTDQEMQNVLNQGTNPMLMQTPFVNQQTGRFDASSLKKFLAEYKNQQTTNPQMAQQYESIYKFWTFIEKQLRTQLLAQKYQSLLAHCLLSNPVEAKMAFKEENEESQIQLAAFPYSSIEDSKVQVSESDLKAKYEELKPRFKQYVETRDIKYIDIQVEASPEDKAGLKKQFADYTKELTEAADPTNVVRKSSSLVNYLGLPVGKDAYPSDIAARLDSMGVGSVYGPVENKQDNTLNLVKLVAKVQLPDSVEYRQIQVGGVTPEAAHKTADSIYTALTNGADFEALAKKYGQTGEKAWMTTRQYQMAPSMDKDTKDYINSLNTMGVNDIKNITLAQGNIILQVLNRKGMVTKYQAAVVKRTIDFSKETYRKAYNQFSSFVSANATADAVVKNAAKNGYRVQEAKDVTTSQHNLAGIRSTREALKWLFDAKEGSVSPRYECGDNNHLLLVILDRINPVGYRSLNDSQVKEMVKAEVIRDKKAEQILAKLNGVTSIAAAKAKGAVVTPVNQVTFASPVFLTATGASEPALSGAVAATAKGAFDKTPVKGNAGVYMFQVTGRTMRPVKYNAKETELRLRQRAMQYAGNFMNQLYINGKVVDNRYLFF